MNIILLGAPGAGKGTQARLIQEHHHLALIATGDILRKEIKRETSLGLQVKEASESGRFLPDEMILQIFEDHLKDVRDQGVILDGIPRTLNQAQKIDEIFKHLGMSLDAVIHLSVDDKELIQRLSNRMMCKTCHASYTPDLIPCKEGICDMCAEKEFIRRPDDEPAVVKARLDIYTEKTKPLLQYYSQTHRLKIVNGMKSVEEVNTEIESFLKSLQVLTRKAGCLYSAQDM
jgi:adenylate kinase